MREWRLWPAISGNRNRCRANETSLFLSATLPRRSSYPAIAPWPAAPSLPVGAASLHSSRSGGAARRRERSRSGGYIARLLALCSLPRTNPGNRTQYVRRNGPYTLVMSCASTVKLPYGPLPRLLLAWVTTEAVRTQSPVLVLEDSLSAFMRKLGLESSGGAGPRAHGHHIGAHTWTRLRPHRRLRAEPLAAADGWRRRAVTKTGRAKHRHRRRSRSRCSCRSPPGVRELYR